MPGPDYHCNCKYCNRYLHKDAFSKRQLKRSVPNRICMECLVGPLSIYCQQCCKQLSKDSFSITQLKSKFSRCKQCILSKQTKSLNKLHTHCIGKDLFTEIRITWPTHDPTKLDFMAKLEISIDKNQNCSRDMFMYKDTIIIASYKLDPKIGIYHFGAFNLLNHSLQSIGIDYHTDECMPILYYRSGSLSVEGITFVLENDSLNSVDLAEFIGCKTQSLCNYYPLHQKMMTKNQNKSKRKHESKQQNPMYSKVQCKASTKFIVSTYHEKSATAES